MNECPSFVERFLPEEKSRKEKDQRNRGNEYLHWLLFRDKAWYSPDLSEYETYLREQRGLSRASVMAHLSTIRARYRKLLKEGILEDLLQDEFSDLDTHDREEMINNILAEIEAAIIPSDTSRTIKPTKVNYTRLTAQNIISLYRQILGAGGLRSQRDLAVFVLLFGFGLRQNEAVSLNVADLNRIVSGKAAIYVKPGFGRSERYILYDGRMPWVKEWLDRWLQVADISDGPVLRSFSRYLTIREGGLSSRSIELILADYSVTKATKAIQVRPMDLRRAHARLLYEGGVNLLDLQARLGLKDANAVLAYIGTERAKLYIPDDMDPFEYFRMVF